MSLWVKDNNEEDDEIEYYSIKSLSEEIKNTRTELEIPYPKFNDLTKCFFCHKSFELNDIIDFYSDPNIEYCKHSNCANIYIKKNLIVEDLQNIINTTWDIDFSYDNIIPSNLKKLNLIYKFTDYNLDFSESNLIELVASDFDKLLSDNFKSIEKLDCYKTLVDFTKFINLTTLTLSKILEPADLTPCINLTNVTLQNINFDINLSGCNKLTVLRLYNITKNINLSGCLQLDSLELKNITTACIDIIDCINLTSLKLENVKNNCIFPQKIDSLTKLHITDISESVDLINYPNIKTITTIITKTNTETIRNSNKNILNSNYFYNLDKLINLEVFIFNDLTYLEIISIQYNFDLIKNNKLKIVNIYSANKECNVIFSNKVYLEECLLDFKSMNKIIIPQNVKKIKYNKYLEIITL